jgi:hypothetical protein
VESALFAEVRTREVAHGVTDVMTDAEVALVTGVELLASEGSVVIPNLNGVEMMMDDLLAGSP